MRMLFLLCGAPASGKTTLAKHLTSKWGTPSQCDAGLVPLVCYSNSRVLQLGTTREHFGGSDAVQLKAILPVSDIMREVDMHIFIEGGKFSNMVFLERVKSYGYETMVYYLNPPAEALQRRQSERKQNPIWLKAQNSKHAKFAALSKAIVSQSDDIETNAAFIESSDFWTRFV